MQIGDSVTYRGRRYVVVGFTPFSVRPFKVELEDPASKRRLWTTWPAEPAERAALRLACEEKQAGGDSS
jgi:hypothetical protein